MIMVIFLLFVSFLLDGWMSLIGGYVYNNLSIFSTIYSLVCLIILSKYFKNNNKYILVSIIVGLLFDIVYTNTFILNAVLFLFISMLFKLVFENIADTAINNVIASVIGIFIYHILSFIILVIIGYMSFDIRYLGVIIIHSIIMTSIYSFIIYYVSDYLYKRIEERRKIW